MKENKSLFLVVLGGRTKQSHIELHDVRWVVAENIEDTFEQLKLEWFGDKKGLHIDSYMKIKYIDGYKLNIKNKNDKNKIVLNSIKKNYLWFINIGGYDPNDLLEKHKFGIVIASTANEAKIKAKERWLKDLKLTHKDDLYPIKRIKGLDNCIPIKKVNNWEIELIPEKFGKCQLFIPDWYGYKRIDK
tara:strand:+ start:1034 stop:1597 length:564 start_codon:yes stop_codon:yes gene_type:complete